MQPSLMSFEQPSDARWSWSLAEGEAVRLAPEAAPRWLLVTAGRVWLTHADHVADDGLPAALWLAAGDSVELPAGDAAVLEGWPTARF